MLINGIPTETLSARDRGLAYGDGHFTTMLIKHGQVVWWPAHLARLQQAFGKHVAVALAVAALAGDEDFAMFLEIHQPIGHLQVGTSNNPSTFWA